MPASAAHLSHGITLVLAAGVLLASCAKQPRHAATPGLENIDDFEAELDRTDRALARLGLGATPSATTMPAPPPADVPAGGVPRSDDDLAPDGIANAEGAAGDADEEAPLLESLEREAMAESAPVAEDRGRRGRWRERRAERKAKGDRCERICDLADATCGLAERVCELSERHPNEPRYQNACMRAEDQCDLASSACTDCSD